MWLNQDLLVKLESKRKMHRQQMQGQATWEKYRDAARLHRDVRKVKAKLQLDLARDAKKNKEGFYRHFNQKRKAQEGVTFLVSNTGRLVTTDRARLRYSTCLLQSSLVIEQMVQKVGTNMVLPRAGAD